MKRVISGALLASSLTIGLGACSGLGNETYPSASETTIAPKIATQVFANPNTAVLDKDNRSAILTPETDFDAFSNLLSELPLAGAQFPRDLESKDENAATLGTQPIRINGHMSPIKHTPRINNDQVCDFVNLDPHLDKATVHIGALALSDGHDDKVTVSWPAVSKGKLSSILEVCVIPGNEPARGVVLAVQPPSTTASTTSTTSYSPNRFF